MHPVTSKTKLDNYIEKRDKIYKAIKSFSLFELQSLGNENGNEITDWYISSSKECNSKIKEAYLQARELLKSDYEKSYNKRLSKNGKATELVKNLLDALIDDDDVREAIMKSEYNADLLPSNTQLAGAPIELVSVPRREMRLRTVLAPVVPLYDYIFIDCAPSLDLLTVNALCAADTVIIPMQCEFFALEGLSELMATLKTVRKKYNRYLDIEGVLFTMYSGRLNLTMQVVAQVKKYFGDKVYRAVIPRTVRLSEAPSFGMPINFYEPNGRGSEAYMELAREFLANNER